MKVTSKKTISFSKINWGIHAGEERELPKEKKAQEIILAHPAITEVGGGSKTNKSTKEEKTKETK